MCVAIYNPAGKPISMDTLRNCWNSNKDGAGFAYIHKKKVKISKGYMKYDDFLAAWNAAKKRYRDSPFLLHFRIRSSGALDADRTHPFEMPNGAMIHNGTIQGTGAKYGDGPSDTQLFIDKFKNDLTWDVVSKNKLAIGQAIEWNKLVFLFHGGEHVIINEEKGDWHEESWFSNSSYKSRSGVVCRVS